MRRMMIFIFSGVVMVTTAFVTTPLATEHEGKCPPRAGQVKVTLPPGEIQQTVEVPVEPCPNLNVQLSGGSPTQLPIILNATVHHGILRITAHLLKPEEGSLDVTIWWRVSYAKDLIPTAISHAAPSGAGPLARSGPTGPRRAIKAGHGVTLRASAPRPYTTAPAERRNHSPRTAPG